MKNGDGDPVLLCKSLNRLESRLKYPLVRLGSGVQCFRSVFRRGFSMAPPLKQQAHALVDNLPESATWDDLAYEAELRASVDRGLADAEAGRVVPIEDMMKEFGVEE